MNKIFIFLFFALKISAQNSAEITTDLVIKYQASTLLYDGKNKVDVESYYVLKNASESHFLSESMFKLDSLQKVETFNKNNFSKIKLKRPLFITKSNGKLRHYENIGNNYTVYSEQLILPWKIETEQKKINNYLCKKATVNYKGRNWVAWFTTEIPINEGPYKFNGLPGLIIEMYDTDQIFKFSLVSISTKKNTISKSLVSYFDETTSNTFKDISESEFYKFRESFYKMSLSDKLKYINRENPSFVGLNIKNSDTGDNMNLANKKASKMNFIEKL